MSAEPTGINAAVNFCDKVALITGASQGIGLAIACALAERGCHVAITARSRPNLDKAAAKLATYKFPVLPLACDVRDPAAVQEMIRAVDTCFHRIDILINNAGISHPNLTADQLPAEVWREVIDTNLGGVFFVTRAALPLMKSGGVIVNNLSIAAKKIFPGSAAYDAGKHGALALTTSLREELRPRGIRVVALLAGATDTEIWNIIWPDAPRKKMMSPATVAQALVDAINLPGQSTAEELTILPSVGTL